MNIDKEVLKILFDRIEKFKEENRYLRKKLYEIKKRIQKRNEQYIKMKNNYKRFSI